MSRWPTSVARQSREATSHSLTSLPRLEEAIMRPSGLKLSEKMSCLCPCNSPTHCPRRIATSVRDRLHFRPNVKVVAVCSLPRFEMKAKRVVKDK